MRLRILVPWALALAACSPPPPPPLPPTPRAEVPVAPAAPDPCIAWPLPRGCARGLGRSHGSLCVLTDHDAFCWPIGPGADRVVTRTPRDAEGLDLLRAGPRADVRIEVPVATRQIAVGRAHQCALGVDGSVWCVGSDVWGQLGRGTGYDTSDGKPRRAAVPAATDLALAADTSCALTGEGEVYCWGEAEGFPPGTRIPLASTKLIGWAVQGVDVGAETPCVLAEDGRVLCRGWVYKIWLPERGMEGVIELAALQQGTCGRRRDGSVTCMSSVTESAAENAALSPAKALVPGMDCAVKTDGVLRCLGPYDSEHDRPGAPEDLTELGAIRAVGSAEGSVDGRTACAATASGELRCWGHVGWSWFFDSTPPHPGPTLWMPGWITRSEPTTMRKPIVLRGPRDVVEVSPRGDCARTADGKVYSLEQPAGGKGERHRLAALTVKGAERATRLLPGNVCAAVRADGSVFALSLDRQLAMGPAPTGKLRLLELPRLAGAVQLETGLRSACVRLADERVRCLPPAKIVARDELAGDFTIPLGEGPASAVFFHNTDVACALPRSGGLLCRDMRDASGTAATNPLSRGSATPVRVLPVE